MNEQYSKRFWSITEVCQYISLSKASVYRLIGAGNFPTSVAVGGAAKRWIREEIEAWAEKRIAERAVKPTPEMPQQDNGGEATNV